jgi:AraC family transcriptional regulator
MSESQPWILANSFEYGWQGVNLILEREARGEIPGAEMDFHQKFHFITIALEPVRASYKTLDGLQHINYEPGDAVILPQAELFPQVWIDRDVPLLELLLNPQQLLRLSIS